MEQLISGTLPRLWRTTVSNKMRVNPFIGTASENQWSTHKNINPKSELTLQVDLANADISSASAAAPITASAKRLNSVYLAGSKKQRQRG